MWLSILTKISTYFQATIDTLHELPNHESIVRLYVYGAAALVSNDMPCSKDDYACSGNKFFTDFREVQVLRDMLATQVA